MPITDNDKWNKWVERNQDDPYSKCCVDVAREVMRILDDTIELTGNLQLDVHPLICQAAKNIDSGGITGFMAAMVAEMVSKCHSRGEEFRKAWNINNQVGDEGEKANESGGVLNPAILVVADKDEDIGYEG